MNKFVNYLPTLLWMLVIFYFSSRSTAIITGTNQTRFLILKSFHLIEYAVLGILLFRNFRKTSWVIFVGYLYAISDEVHQYFVPGRTSKFQDTLIDLLGIIIGLLIVRQLRRLEYLK